MNKLHIKYTRKACVSRHSLDHSGPPYYSCFYNTILTLFMIRHTVLRKSKPDGVVSEINGPHKLNR